MGETLFAGGRIFGGELKNIPVGCFSRGPFLQEKKGPCPVPDVAFLRFPARGGQCPLPIRGLALRKGKLSVAAAAFQKLTDSTKADAHTLKGKAVFLAFKKN